MRRRISGSARTVAAVSLLLLVCAGAGLLWVAGSEFMLRTLVDRAVNASAGKLIVTGMHGSLYGSLRIDSLGYGNDFQHIEARQLELDWSLRELLLRRRLQISNLHVQQLDVDIIKNNPEPWLAPQSLGLPVSLDIPAARVERLTVQYSGEKHDLGALQASLNDVDGQFHFSSSLAGGWGKADATLALPAAAPFALDGTLVIAATHYSARTKIGGNLAAITLTGDVGADSMAGRLQLLLTPFQKSLIRQATLQAQHLDPQRYAANFPHADLALDLNLQAAPAGGFQGSLEIRNLMPGPYDHARLPLRELRSAFAGGLESLALSDIQLDLGEAGRFAGSGTLQQQHLRLDLSTSTFNLHGVHSKLKPTRLAGDLHLGLASDAQSLQAVLEQRNYHIRVDAAQRDAVVEIKQASIQSAGSELSFSGSLPLAKNRDFQAQGQLRNFNPKNFGDYPAAAINAKFSATGSLLPQWHAALHVAIADSSYRGKALGGQGDMKIAAEHIQDAMLKLSLGSNRLTAQGAYGQAQDRLKWQLDAPDIDVLGTGFAGQLQARGEISGSWTQPAGKFSLSAENLDWNGTQRVAKLSAGGQLDAGLEGELALHAELSGYRSGAPGKGGLQLDHAALAVHGRRSDHEIELSAHNDAFDAHALLAGAWLDTEGWKGVIRQFENKGKYPVALRQPARFAAAAKQLSLTGADLGVAQGIVHVDELTLHGGSLTSRGRIEALNVADMLNFAGARTEQIESTLTLDGKWQVDAADKLNARIELSRNQGDLTAPGEIRTSMGLDRLTCNLDVVNNRLSGRLVMNGTTLGHVAATVETTLVHKGNIWGIAKDSPVTADVDASMASVAWASPFLGTRTEIGGAVEAHYSANGSMGAPNLSGEITGDKLRFAYPGQGVYLKDGSLHASMRENRFVLDKLLMHGKEGTLSGSGSVTLETDKTAMQIGFEADKLLALDRPDRQLTMSGTGTLSLLDGRIHVAARLKADKARIEWGKGDAPTLSPDVVVLGRERNNAQKPTQISLDLGFDLGKEFYFKGEGIDARLEGSVSMTGKAGDLPATSGTISVAEGKYLAYGQNLAIDRGILNFSGPMDNPGLNIVAMRKNQTVEAGVTITGTALQPQVKLTSNPDVPDSEKLSWLVLGHGLDSSSGGEFSVLQSAASALFSKGQGVPLQSRIAQAAGLDEIVLSGQGGLESSVLTLGKRLSSRAYLSYEQGLTGISNVAKISYTLTKRLSIKAQAGTESALDLFYEFTFD
jgi:translocation and assembly module TamB